MWPGCGYLIFIYVKHGVSLMVIDSVFLVALQSCTLLGLIHGINPCGHSWLILAPFVVGEKQGARVTLLTLAFIGGTTSASLALGATLGGLSMMIPPSWLAAVDRGTALIIALIGTVLLIQPSLLHHHDHAHGQGGEAAESEHDRHDHTSCGCPGHNPGPFGYPRLVGRKTAGALFTIGFINMIVPCPTLAVMYKYALESGSHIKSIAVFFIYAIATGVAVGAVIFCIYRVNRLVTSLGGEHVEKITMRAVGGITLFYGLYSLFGLSRV